ncbi:MAG TPA: glycosyltransferase [Nitrososphaeraceae archaeon]
MVSTEFPPMKGGVGRYTYNLTNSLRKLGVDVFVVCDVNGMEEYREISSTNPNNSEVLIKIVDSLRPDIVHVQYEQGLYGLYMDPKKPSKVSTNLDTFYNLCKVPIVTTFHSTYTFKQWMNRARLMASASPHRARHSGRFLSSLGEYWKHILNYYSFHKSNREKVRKSKESIVFSDFMLEKIGGGKLIYHGAEPYSNNITKEEARAIFSLPLQSKIALAIGFKTATKGWSIFERMRIPQGWSRVINSSRNYYCIESDNSVRIKRGDIIDLQRGYLSDEELSLLLRAVDAVILPYTVGSSSGVMFDALAHNIPFVATDLEFFREFSSKGLGITAKRDPNKFSEALMKLEKDYQSYINAISQFKENLRWDNVAKRHLEIYTQIINRTQVSAIPAHHKL